jgi:RNA polymerase sigma-70 factor, ECF subfamily
MAARDDAGTTAAGDTVLARDHGHWEAWMAAAQGGDGRAYDALLREALPLLRRVARRRLADPAEAEDAVQDALLCVHRLRHTYDPDRPLRPWLAMLCGRRCVDRLRQRGRQALREQPLDDLIEVLAAPELTDSAGRSVAAGELRAAIAALPRVQRLALTLAKLQDLPLAEASARSGLSVGALKVATHRAIGTLRDRLRLPAEA